MLIGIVGWAAAACFAFCGVPQVVKTYRTKSARDLSWGFLGLWAVGEVLFCSYIVGTTGLQQVPLLANYLVNGVMVGYLLYAKAVYR